MKLLSLFSGIGAFEKALVNIGIDFQLVNYCDIDKYASKAYAAIHNVDESLNLGDITKIEIDKLPKGIDIITHGSPCQDFSVNGKGRGADEGSGTRSSLMWNTVEIIKHTLPKYVVWENVKNIISKKHVHNFNKYIDILKDLGYTSYYQVLNSKNYGVPQNRERVYCISILGDHKPFIFPDPIKLELRLKDILVNKVDQKYYIKDEVAHPLIEKIELKKIKESNELNMVGRIDVNSYDLDNRVYDSENIFPTLRAKCPGQTVLYKIKEATKQGYKLAEEGDSVDLNYVTSKHRRGRVGKQICTTLDTQCNKNVVQDYRIRKLIPLECWRLQGFSDSDFEKAKEVPTSNAQLYKMAGNSITVNVLEAIFENLLNDNIDPEIDIVNDIGIN